MAMRGTNVDYSSNCQSKYCTATFAKRVLCHVFSLEISQLKNNLQKNVFLFGGYYRKLYICTIQNEIIMKLTTENNSYLIYSVYEDRIDIDNIKSYAKGDGSKLIKELKNIAYEMGLPIELYSEPQDDTISQENLNAFYEKNGFELHPDDVDYSYYVWGN